MKSGKLLLIGAGPGDPELLTLKAIKALQKADVILYDALINPKIFDLIFEDEDISNSNKFIFVGKRKNFSQGKQEEINSLILKFLKQGKIIARLKGGDPLVFARGVEEYDLAVENDFQVEIIPGLTSSLSLASLNAITLTLRNHSDSILLETAHDFSSTKANYWLAHIQRGGTLILYMGLSHVVEICDFLKASFSKNLKIIAIENGSLESQRTLESNVSDIAQQLIDQSFKSPVIFYIGEHIAKQRTKIYRHCKHRYQLKP